MIKTKKEECNNNHKTLIMSHNHNKLLIERN